ncbi:hypothetical protein AHAS_Ahas03G0239100 [Arachis hypogaea]
MLRKSVGLLFETCCKQRIKDTDEELSWLGMSYAVFRGVDSVERLDTMPENVMNHNWGRTSIVVRQQRLTKAWWEERKESLLVVLVHMVMGTGLPWPYGSANPLQSAT